MKRNIIEGTGTWVQSNLTYSGSFANDKFNGYGVYTSNGVSTSGFFRDGQLA